MTDSLYVSALNGSNASLVGGWWMDEAAVWSPDGTRIAFVALTDDSTYALCVVSADGTNLRQLMPLNTGDSTGLAMLTTPAWSSDGTRIAISSLVSDDGYAIFVVSADGTEQRQITTASGVILGLTWQPQE